ncbi:hypothetical protein EON63_24120 [archaeon]|nr:MAG: hypothetical protein EON63_24120 [archaeon]
MILQVQEEEFALCRKSLCDQLQLLVEDANRYGIVRMCVFVWIQHILQELPLPYLSHIRVPF